MSFVLETGTKIPPRVRTSLGWNDGNGLLVVQITDTPNSSVTDSSQMWRNFTDTKFDIFAIIPHTDEGLYDRLVFW